MKISSFKSGPTREKRLQGMQLRTFSNPESARHRGAIAVFTTVFRICIGLIQFQIQPKISVGIRIPDPDLVNLRVHLLEIFVFN
jgi:hypothetical protein